jgi:signal peptidase I
MNRSTVFAQPNGAMEPTVMRGEEFVLDRKPFVPGRGSLIVFDHEGQLLFKRVIAVPGDVIEGRNLQVFVNGKVQDEPYIQHVGPRPIPPQFKSLETFGPVTVPQGKLFVAGDNRDYSLDSRNEHFGLISIGDVRGRPERIVQSVIPGRVGKSLE